MNKSKIEKSNAINKVQKSPSEVSAKLKSANSNIRRQPNRHQKSKNNRYNRNNDFEYDKKIISIRRVTRVYKGGKRMQLSVFLVVGDKKGRVGLGLGKGADVRLAEKKAYNQAVKKMVNIQLKGRTIPHMIKSKFNASKVLLKPAGPGTGVIAGSAVRSVVEMAGVKDILTKQLGSSSAINNAYATIKALLNLRTTRIG